MSEEIWLEADTEASNAEPTAAAVVLESVASTLRDAPEGTRYDLQLVIDERPATECNRQGGSE